MVTAMAHLFVHGHDLDFRTLFPRKSSGLAGALDFANIPPTRFKRKQHWLDAQLHRGQFGGDARQPRRDTRRQACLGVRAEGRR